ncbi:MULTISPECIES: hypothetical protein [unclassified Bradyrhizobium]|uniref:hypothetical protein n=1 Tax=unclassified Bradyrhizobium TaxID=2631580 RepID=UPI00143D07AE|nr:MULTISPECIES: hypothetical protein [unclassified Bradyrhizobium]
MVYLTISSQQSGVRGRANPDRAAGEMAALFTRIGLAWADLQRQEKVGPPDATKH